MLQTIDFPPALDAQIFDAGFRAFIRTNVARADAAEATIESYLREARFFAAYLAGQNLSIRDVGPNEVREWVRSLVEAGLMPTTIGLKISAVRRLLDAVVDAGILASNPAKGVSGPRDKRITGAAATRTLSLDEARTLIAAAASHRNPIIAERDRALVALLRGRCNDGHGTGEAKSRDGCEVDGQGSRKPCADRSRATGKLCHPGNAGRRRDSSCRSRP